MSYIFNGSGSGSGGAGSNAILLKDTDGVLWEVDVLPTGNLETVSLGPQSYTPVPIVLVDSSSVQWNLTVQTTGNLETQPV